MSRVEADRHFSCTAEKCSAPTPAERYLVAGYVRAKCIPRKVWWLRTKDSAGRRVSRAFKTESEARELARKVEAARVLGQDFMVAATKVPLFRDVAAEALKVYASTMSPRPSTLANHRGFLAGHLIPMFGDKPVTAATCSTLEIQRWLAEIRGRLSDSTIKTSMPTLRLVLDHAVKLGLLAVNPLRTGERLWRPAPTAQVDPFTSSELRAIIKAAAVRVSPDFACLVQVMAQGGLRPGEGLALRRQDVNEATGVVSVTGSQGRGGRGPTKNPYSVRKVSVLHPVTEDTSSWRPVAAGAGAGRVVDWLSILVLGAADAETRLWPYSAVRLDRYWKRTLKAAGVRYRKPHALRHSFASILLSRGANLLAVQKAGGWRSAGVLLQTYAHWMGEEASSEASSGATHENRSAVNLTV